MIVAKLYSPTKIKCNLNFEQHLAAKIENVVVGAMIPEYKGDYTITPKVSEQTLETKGKKMADNVTVEEIPVYEVSNDMGITITIGGN